jgi:hypothetical protein
VSFVRFSCAYTSDILVSNEVEELSPKGYDDSMNKLATGHSARDIFELLDSKNIFIELKLLPWALGLNILNP